MKTKQEMDEITDTLIDFGVKMAIASATMKMLSNVYKENPNMFWSYKRNKLRKFIYNCRI